MLSLGANGFKFLFVISVVIIVLLQLRSVEEVGAVVIGDCGSKNASGSLTSVDIVNCGEKDEKCPLIRGKNSSIEVAFHTRKKKYKLLH